MMVEPLSSKMIDTMGGHLTDENMIFRLYVPHSFSKEQNKLLAALVPDLNFENDQEGHMKGLDGRFLSISRGEG